MYSYVSVGFSGRTAVGDSACLHVDKTAHDNFPVILLL